MKRLFNLITLFILSVIYTYSNHIDSCYSVYNSNLKEEFYIMASKMPVYLEGDSVLYNYIYSNVTYDNIDKECPMPKERVLVFVYIDNKGRLMDLEIVGKNKEEYSFFDKQVFDLLKNLECSWKAGECNGEKIYSRRTLFFYFNLRDISKFIRKTNPDWKGWCH